MTNEEAIKELEEDKALYMPDEWIEEIDRDTPDGRLITALDMAIKALEQISHIKDRPCEACEFHKGSGCSKWDCIFEENTAYEN